jgi:hypothetical protein
MMKKIRLLTCLLMFGISASAQIQVSAQACQQDTIVTDTVFYYFNKYYFKTGVQMGSFPFYKSAASTVTQVTHVGSRFDNKDPNLEVSGLLSYASREVVVASASISVHMYLCNLDGNGMPVLPAVDSVMTKVSGAANITSSPLVVNYRLIGGSFPNGRRHKMTGPYAVLFRNMSTVPGDTVRLMRTAGKTATNSLASPAEKNSESYGYASWNKVFYSATNFTATGFGVGTDYEFAVAPIVTYTLHAEHLIPQAILDNTVCIFDVHTFTNASSPEFTSRFYNMYEFVRKWNQNPPFNPNTAPVNGWPQDSAVFWNFEPNEQGFGFNRPPGPRVNLPYNSSSNTIQFYTSHGYKDINGEDSAVCWPANKFFTRWRSMNIYGRGNTFKTTCDFTICTQNCGRLNEGVDENSALAKLAIAPNPAKDGVTTLTGMKGTNTILVIDLLGQVIYREKTDNEQFTLNLGNIAAGTYFIRVINADNSTRVAKILKE